MRLLGFLSQIICQLLASLQHWLYSNLKPIVMSPSACEDINGDVSHGVSNQPWLQRCLKLCVYMLYLRRGTKSSRNRTASLFRTDPWRSTLKGRESICRRSRKNGGSGKSTPRRPLHAGASAKYNRVVSRGKPISNTDLAGIRPGHRIWEEI